MNIRIGKMLEECVLFGRNELCRERGRYAKKYKLSIHFDNSGSRDDLRNMSFRW